MSSISTVGVVGLGTMGAGIAEVFARNGYTVTAVDLSEETLAAGRARIEASTARGVERGKLTEAERAEAIDRIAFTASVDDLASAELIIEAVPESLELKREIFERLDKVAAPSAILATNTSSLSVTEIAVATARPSQVIGFHFFNPTPVQGFVEVVRTLITSEAVVETAVQVTESLGKNVVVVGDRGGFIASGLLFGYLNQAAGMFEQKYASRDDIDAAMRFGCGLPMGPLAVLDLIGLDSAYEILDSMYKQGGDRRHAPAPILKQMITAGRRGRKDGRGFYSYEKPGSSKVVADAANSSGAGMAASPRDIKQVGVVGSGTMASGIVEVFAKSGFDTIVVARSEEKAATAKAAVAKSLDRAVSRGKLAEADRDAILARITPSASQDDLATVDLVVEAVAEDISIKVELFRNLDRICKPGAVLATTTSSLPVVEMAAATKRPEDVVGLHFFNPAAIMKLVEIVTTVSTGEDVIATAQDICKRTGKVAVQCGDRAGFIVNALLFPYLNDAVKMLEANYASADEIDLAMKKGCGYPMGPFELLDVVGNDVSLAIQQTLHREFHEPGFSPAPMLEHVVTAGFLGRKTGRGFRSYAK